jgi:hypothetical protein
LVRMEIWFCLVMFVMSTRLVFLFLRAASKLQYLVSTGKKYRTARIALSTVM